MVQQTFQSHSFVLGTKDIMKCWLVPLRYLLQGPGLCGPYATLINESEGEGALHFLNTCYVLVTLTYNLFS